MVARSSHLPSTLHCPDLLQILSPPEIRSSPDSAGPCRTNQNHPTLPNPFQLLQIQERGKLNNSKYYIIPPIINPHIKYLRFLSESGYNVYRLIFLQLASWFIGALMHPESTDYCMVYLRVNGCYFWFNVAQIVTSIVLVVFLFLENHFAVEIVEILIAFEVALDLLIRFFTEGTNNFRKNWDNRLNAVILLLLVVSITTDLLYHEITHYDGGVIAGLLLFSRYIIQGIRLCRLFWQSKKALDATKHQGINLNEIVEEEHEENMQ